MPTTIAREKNRGVRKVCPCDRRRWAKCAHPWHFNFKPKGGPSYRFSLDAEIGQHIASKTEAEALAEDLRTQIRAGTFRRRTDLAPVEAPPAVAADVVTLASFGETYFERRGKPAASNERSCLARLVAFAPDGEPALGTRSIATLTEDAIELFFAQLRREGRAASTRNKYVQLVKAMFRWGT